VRKGKELMFRIIKALFAAIFVLGVIFLSEGFPGEYRSLDLRSGDIACISCALRIKKTISKMEGVSKVEVSAGTKQIHVEYEEEKVTERQIIRKVSDLVFRVEKVKSK
jgi:copper chaperone CopZ